MKLTRSILATTALATHTNSATFYLGGTYKMIQRRDGQLKIENTQSWLRGNWPYQDKYKGKCRTTAQSDGSNYAYYCESDNCSPMQLYYTRLDLFCGWW